MLYIRSMSMQQFGRNQGFTIIEVMIVLAVAALILIIVFIAVPSVERDSRNVERKDDAAFISSQRQLYDENSGAVMAAGQGTCPGGGVFASFCQYIDSGLAYYVPADITVINNGYTPPTSLPTLTVDTVYTETYLVCNDTGTAATTTNASPTQTVVMYALESAGGPVDQCIESTVFGAS